MEVINAMANINEDTEAGGASDGGPPVPVALAGEVCSSIPTIVVETKGERDPNTGTKVFPICNDADMKDLSTSTEELSSLCFAPSFSLIEAQLEIVPPGVTSASFASHSTCTIPVVSKHTSSNSNCGSMPMMYSPTADSNDTDGMLAQLMEKSAIINETVINRTKSKHGRSGQRWIVDAALSSNNNKSNNKVIRLVTGCIPILKGGKIMMVSASKKKAWILPKGGWEMDEELEESAIRETYEEAGVIGVLGPKLSEVQYETRKARERRLSSLADQLALNPVTKTEFSSGWSDVSQLSEDDHIIDMHQQQLPQSPERSVKPKIQLFAASQAIGVATINEEELCHKQPSKKPLLQDNSSEQHHQAGIDTAHMLESEASKTKSYTHVCANMFPLYVKEAMTTWPECGRLRKAVDIDEAIKLLEARPEMQSMLLDLKRRGLHRV